MKKKAKYGRQSIDKKDSISIETQLNFCENICKLNNWDSVEYFDKGYSGSDLDRPAFQKLINDIKMGLIDTVICYRLDRISRSLVDFANLLEFFRKYNVEFISVTENFDTSTPIGRAMINIIMVFAQLERETIQLRIKDNYFARAKNGSFVGGGVPYGFLNKKIPINGKMVSVLEHDLEKIENVKKIYKMYIQNKTIRSIAREFSLKENNLITDKFIRKILTNPIYVKADTSIYYYYKQEGYKIYNKPEEFNGKNGITIYGKEKGKKHRTITEKEEQLIVLVKNDPIIESKDFLYVQEKLKMNKKTTTAKKQGKYTWLTGILKCKDCKCSVGAKVTKGYKYLMCSKHRLYNACTNTTSYKLEEVESIIYSKICSYLLDLDLEKISKKDVDTKVINTLNNLNIKKINLQTQLDNLINAIANGTDLDNIFESKIKEINQKLKETEKEIYTIENKVNNKNNNVNIDLYKKSIDLFLNNFYKMSIEDKHNLVKIFVKEIYINDDNIEIIKNI